MDVVRGSSQRLFSELTDAEDDTASLTSFDSNGFSVSTVGGVTGRTNQSSQTYAGWCWDAGTSTVSNTQGSITSQVRANPTAGFSVVTYTGTGAAATVGHGLGAKPSFFVVKRRDVADSWNAYHSSLGATKYVALNSVSAATTYNGLWNDTEPTSTVFSILNDVGCNATGGTYVAYCFAPVVGYSSFGSYVGNGSSTDNTFVYTGMRPRFVMLKRSDSTGNWVIWDAVRNSYNVANSILLPNSSAAEYSPDAKIDILSNGFKVRDNSGDSGSSGGTYIYAAFAEAPFNYSRAR